MLFMCRVDVLSIPLSARLLMHLRSQLLALAKRTGSIVALVRRSELGATLPELVHLADIHRGVVTHLRFIPLAFPCSPVHTVIQHCSARCWRDPLVSLPSEHNSLPCPVYPSVAWYAFSPSGPACAGADVLQITGPPPNVPTKHYQTPTSTPLPHPTPLSADSQITPTPEPLPPPPTSGDGKPLYVPGSQAERQARLGRMSSPLRRGTHESWWSRDMGWFNAVAKVRVSRLCRSHTTRLTCRPYRRIAY